MDWQAIHVTQEIFQWLAIGIMIWLLHDISSSTADALTEIERFLRESADKGE